MTLDDKQEGSEDMSKLSREKPNKDVQDSEEEDCARKGKLRVCSETFKVE